MKIYVTSDSPESVLLTARAEGSRMVGDAEQILKKGESAFDLPFEWWLERVGEVVEVE